MSGSERGGNNRRKQSAKRRDRAEAVSPPRSPREDPGRKKRDKGGGRESFAKAPPAPRPQGPPRLKWTPTRPPSTPLPVPDCPVCGKAIRDLAQALSDRKTGSPVHFDCILEKITKNETRDAGDVISYIGGGRFGVLAWQNPQEPRSFRIKRIIEWENKEDRAVWRKPVADRFSMT